MYAISSPPVTAYLLTTGHFQHLCRSYSATQRGDIYLGLLHSRKKKWARKNIAFYAEVYRADPSLPDPVTWFATYPRHALIAQAQLVSIIPFDETLLSDFERRFLPRKRHLYCFENIQPLDPVVYCKQDTIIWEYDEATHQPKRFFPLTQEQIDLYFDLCLAMERCYNDRTTCKQLEATHPGNFIFHYRYWFLRSGILNRHGGVAQLDRNHWRSVFEKRFSGDPIKPPYLYKRKPARS